MTFFTRPNIRALVAPRSRVRISRRRWAHLLGELAQRGGGVRESGAFLLADREAPRRVIDVVYFDDLDPNSLTGGVSMPADAFATLWSICRERQMRVVADVHTHPGHHVVQSTIDQTNPMVARSGHVAVIVPHLAQRPTTAADCGIHIYQGDHKWQVAYGRAAKRALYIGRLA